MKFYSNVTDYLETEYRYIKVEKQGLGLVVTLNRPEKRNAFTPLLVNELGYAIQGANEDVSINYVVLQAAGPVFCAGMDLKVFRGEIEEHIPEKFVAQNITAALALRQLEKPLIGVLDGPVLAGGFLFINECTLVLAHENVWFQLPEANIGLFPFQVMERLSEIVGERKAMEWALLGEKISVKEAQSAGLVNRIFTTETKTEALKTITEKLEKIPINLLNAAISSFRAMKKLEGKEKALYLKKVLEQFR